MSRGRRALVACLLGAALSASAEDAARKTLARTEDLVVLTGAELPRLKGIKGDLLRIYASRAGKLVPIPFQVDERTPELAYCWRSGSDPVKDVDEGRLDDDDEVVFRAADSGEKTAATVEGATKRVEVELEDPRDGGKAWAYVLVFEDKEHPPPPPAERDHVELVREETGGALLRTRFFEIASSGSVGLGGRPLALRLRAPDGSFGPVVVSDAARFKLHASYLRAQIDRDDREVRTALGASWIDGPVRLIAPFTAEAYLIWGNWISTTARSYLVLHDHTLEVHVHLAVPVNLDRDHPSEASLSIEAAPAAAGWRARKLPDGTALLAGTEGGVAARLELDPRLRAQAREGATLAVDLTGLRKSEEATPYGVTFVLAVSPAGTPAALHDLIEARDTPLRHAAR